LNASYIIAVADHQIHIFVNSHNNDHSVFSLLHSNFSFPNQKILQIDEIVQETNSVAFLTHHSHSNVTHHFNNNFHQFFSLTSFFIQDSIELYVLEILSHAFSKSHFSHELFNFS
jgi:hypothetical protein